MFTRNEPHVADSSCSKWPDWLQPFSRVTSTAGSSSHVACHLHVFHLGQGVANTCKQGKDLSMMTKLTIKWADAT
jgi:hypothetical protein